VSEMRSSDRFGGGYVNYTSPSAPYQLSSLTQELFESVSRGVTHEQLKTRFASASDAELKLAKGEIGMAQMARFGEPAAYQALGILDRMAGAEIEGRQPGRTLFSQIQEMSEKGAQRIEIQRHLEKASTEALRAIPRCLDQFLAEVRGSTPSKGAWLSRLSRSLGLSGAVDGRVRQTEALVETVRAVSNAVLAQRAGTQG
jgi:hypothetical protein